MPYEWRIQFVELMESLDQRNWKSILPERTTYKVELRKHGYNDKDQFVWRKKVDDPLADYQRGRRDVFGERSYAFAKETIDGWSDWKKSVHQKVSDE